MAPASTCRSAEKNQINGAIMHQTPQNRRAFRLTYIILAVPMLALLIVSLASVSSWHGFLGDPETLWQGVISLIWVISPYMVLYVFILAIERWWGGRAAGLSALVSALVFLLWTVFILGKGMVENSSQPHPFGFDFELVLIFAPFYQLPVALICGMVCLLVAALARIRAKPPNGGGLPA